MVAGGRPAGGVAGAALPGSPEANKAAWFRSLVMTFLGKVQGIPRGHGRLLASGVATLSLLLAAPALAQKTPVGGSTTAGTAFNEGVAFCFDAVDGVDNAEAILSDLGWMIDDVAESGPYQIHIDASKFGDVLGDLYYYAINETYPGLSLTYCTFEIEGAISMAGLEAAAQEQGFEGEMTVIDDATYGTWAILLDDAAILIQVEAYPDYFYLQLNWVGEAGMTAGPK